MSYFFRQREVERLGGTYNPEGTTFEERYINIDPSSDAGRQLMMNDPDFNGRHPSNPRPWEYEKRDWDKIPFSGSQPSVPMTPSMPSVTGVDSVQSPDSSLAGLNANDSKIIGEMLSPTVPMTPSMPTNRDANDNNNIGMAQLSTEFPMTSTPSDNPPPHNQDQMTDILPSSSVNPVTQVQQSNNVKIPAPGYQPSVPIDREPPKQVLQSQPDPKKVSRYKPPKPKKSIYESLRERRAQKQPVKKKTPKPSVNRAIKPMQARRAMQAGSNMRSLALQNMKRDKQATDVAQAKTDAIQAQIAKLRKK